MESLKGKSVLVTGATGGIGAATTRLLQAGGAQLFITGRNEMRLKALRDELQLPADRYVAADLSSAKEVELLKERYYSVFPGMDILVNAAGVGIIKPMETLSVEDFMTTLQANLVAPFLLMKAWYPSSVPPCTSTCSVVRAR